MINPYFDSTIQSAGQAPQVGIDPTGLQNPGSIYKKQSPVDWNGGGINWGSAAQGVADLALNSYSMANQRIPLYNQQISSSQYDQNSNPSYTAGAAQNEAMGIHPRGAQGSELGSAAAKGFTTGLAASGGNPIVAVGGAIINTGVTAIAGGARKRAQQRQQAQALAKVIAAQQSYNTQDQTFRNQQNQRIQYLRRTNPYARDHQVAQTRF